MYHLIENETGKLLGSSKTMVSQSNCETIEKDFTEEEMEKLQNGSLFIDGEIIESEEWIEKKQKEIKQKYQDEIFAKYSLTDQLNMSNEAQLLTAMAQYEKRDLTDEEASRLLEIKAVKEWIDSKRLECAEEISTLSA